MEEITGTDNNSIPAKMVSVIWCDFLVDNSFCYPHIQHGIHIARIPEFLDGLIREVFDKRGIFDLYMLNIYYRDTAGQETFRSLIPSYIRDSYVAVVVYDVASRQSFVNTSKWIEEVRTERVGVKLKGTYGYKVFPRFLRQVSIEEAEAKARDLNVMFIETSAKAGFNIKALFRKIAAALPGMETLSFTKQEDTVDVNLKSTNANASQSQQQSGGCAC
ncbi:hypothetical protein ES288_A11G085500v1 [Gossypium darwinii]|uniref:Uncharacterized protein n=1 Tax=Gossypium darwinii TaxID=34276 RepID=A0A5D2EIX2_GOSDA|nr:hypothetical protein ES288_A11G085500v1 [Gossypium darwinii]